MLLFSFNLDRMLFSNAQFNIHQGLYWTSLFVSNILGFLQFRNWVILFVGLFSHTTFQVLQFSINQILYLITVSALFYILGFFFQSRDWSIFFVGSVALLVINWQALTNMTLRHHNSLLAAMLQIHNKCTLQSWSNCDRVEHITGDQYHRVCQDVGPYEVEP